MAPKKVPSHAVPATPLPVLRSRLDDLCLRNRTGRHVNDGGGHCLHCNGELNPSVRQELPAFKGGR